MSTNHTPQATSMALILFPVRLFIGMGWLRAGTEKARDPKWFSGDGVREFLDTNDGVGFFEPAIEWMFGGSVAPGTAAVVYGLQVLVGLGILLGAGTSAMLLAGMTMNLVFLLSGAPNPSVFYLLLQLILLWAGTGAILGVDRRARPHWSPLLVAQPQAIQEWVSGRFGKVQAVLGMLLLFACLPFINTVEPQHVVEDPAAVAAMCGVFPVVLFAAGLATKRYPVPPV